MNGRKLCGYLALGLLLSLWLAACGGTSGPSSQTVTVTLFDPNDALEGAYYRLDGGAWQALSFSQNQASFNATGSYEVAARCEMWQGPYELLIFKGSVAKATSVPITCGYPAPGPTPVLVELELNLPSQVGNVSIQDGDEVFVGWVSATISGGMATVMLELPEGEQQLAITIIRDPWGTPEPLAGRLITLEIDANQQLYPVAASGYVALTQRSVSSTPPAGFMDSGQVLYYRDGMRDQLGLMGFGASYGAFPSAQGGVYLGFYQAQNGNGWLTVTRDTGGADWTINWPQPWGSGQLSFANGSFSLAHPQAQWYALFFSNGLIDTDSQMLLRVFMVIEADGATTNYAIPDLEPLGVSLVSASTSVWVNSAAITRGSVAGYMLINMGSTELSEALFRGFDLAVAESSHTVTFP